MPCQYLSTLITGVEQMITDIYHELYKMVTTLWMLYMTTYIGLLISLSKPKHFLNISATVNLVDQDKDEMMSVRNVADVDTSPVSLDLDEWSK